jgi:hypothetical protein
MSLPITKQDSPPAKIGYCCAEIHRAAFRQYPWLTADQDPRKGTPAEKPVLAYCSPTLLMLTAGHTLKSDEGGVPL